MDKGLLADATSTDDGPVSGYMLKEISRATISSYPACNQLIDYLGTRIKKNNRNIKYKCCVIIKHVCREGRVEFKREVSRILESIKECCQYKGDVDALRGDEPNNQVRVAAKEALDAIFDSQMPVNVSSVAGAGRITAFGGGYDEGQTQQKQPETQSTGYMKSISDKMSSMMGDDGAQYQGHPGATDMNPDAASGRQSYQSNSHGGQSGSSSSYGGPSGATSGGGGGGSYENRGSGGMQGIGSGPDPRDEKSWMQKISDAASSAKDKVGGMRSGGGQDASVRFANDSANYSDYHSNRGSNAQGKDTSNTYNPNANGSGASSSASSLSGAATGPYGQKAPAAPVSDVSFEPGIGGMVPDMPNRPGYGRAGSAASDGTYEGGVIAGLCESGGMKAVPPQDKLATFLNTAPTLSPDVVGSCLLNQLNEDAWQTRVKALMVISSLALAKGCAAHKTWWCDPDRLEELRTVNQSDSKASVRSQAGKTLRTLGEGGDAPAAAAAPRQASAAPQPQQTSMSLLDDYDEPSAPASAAHAVTDFDPLGMQQQQPQTQTQPNYGQPPPVPAMTPAPQDSGGGMFDGMDMGGGSEPMVPAQHSAAVNKAVSAVAHDPNLMASVSNLLNDTDPYAAAPSRAPAPAPASNNSFSVFDSLIDADPVVSAPPVSMSAFADFEPVAGQGPRGSAAPNTGMYSVPNGQQQQYQQQQQQYQQQQQQGQQYQQQQQQGYGQQPYLSRPMQGGPQQGQYHNQGQQQQGYAQGQGQGRPGGLG
jgi:hypothetical protein